MKEQRDNQCYDDMIHLPHPTSKRHPRMSNYDRAAQFSPFAALTGHGAAIEETARLTQREVELDDDVKARINEKLQILRMNLERHVRSTFTYFLPDEKKAGGAYVTYSGSVRRIDEYEETVILDDGKKIPISRISEIESELFDA